MFGHKRVPSCDGGIEVVVGELSSRMAEAGHKVVLYNRKSRHVCDAQYGSEKLSEYKGVVLKEVLTIDKAGFAAISSSFFAALKCIFGRYDVVHVHAEGPAAMCWLLKLFGEKVIVTIHGLDWQRAKWGGFASRYIRFGEKMSAKYADRIIVLSNSARRYFRDTYDVDAVFLPNGVEKPILRPADRITVQWGLRKDDYVLFLGRIVPEKGIRYLIEAFKNVKTDKKLVIAGSASDTENFAADIERLAQDDKRIIFTGFVQGELKDELYSNAYVYTLPSDLEGMPLGLLEGMSYGNCCLTSDIDECVEVVEDQAVVFRKSDISDLREKLQLLCDEPQTVEKYRKDVAAFIISKYDWNDITDRTLSLYSSVCRENQS
ncbi:MAG: glycosyltransferase family 4 protein [Oscillospiraceae bacterium]|nr:glycosyltransferase family 4 protein [Oscillospiraceae bacterium]